MTPTQRRLYSALIRLHPADFRNCFGREMLYDFEDATNDGHLVSPYLDAVQSLLRQWIAHLFPAAPSPQPARVSLLSGQYVPLSQPNPSLFELLRAACIATLLFLSIGFATSPRQSTLPIANAGLRSVPTQDASISIMRPSHRVLHARPFGSTTATSAPPSNSSWIDPDTETTYEFNLWPAATYAAFLCLYFTLRNYLRKRRALRG